MAPAEKWSEMLLIGKRRQAGFVRIANRNQFDTVDISGQNASRMGGTHIAQTNNSKANFFHNAILQSALATVEATLQRPRQTRVR